MPRRRSSCRRWLGYLTDGGNPILDCRFAALEDPAELDRELQPIAGVLETGLFIDLCDTLIVGSNGGVLQIQTGFEQMESRARNRA